MKWEYLTVKWHTIQDDTTDLARLGDDEWELVCAVNDDVVFKRRRSEDKPIAVILEDEADKNLFERCWVAYNRRGSKSLAKAQWSKLTDNEKSKVLPHVEEYVKSVSAIKYQVYFERYLRDKRFLDVIHGEKAQTLFQQEATVQQQKQDKLIIGNTEYR